MKAVLRPITVWKISATQRVCLLSSARKWEVGRGVSEKNEQSSFSRSPATLANSSSPRNFSQAVELLLAVSSVLLERHRGLEAGDTWQIKRKAYSAKWEFPKIRGTLFGVLLIRILLFRVLC